jgi:tRNA threonylcarbamoyladenosine biosynthesis protein TsaB
MTPDFAAPPRRVLALETSTDRTSVAVGNERGETLALHQGGGGSEVSTTLLPAIQALLTQVGWRMDELDAIAFGCGPGAFTGLRSSCAVVQGLAFAGRPGGIPVVPVNTLLAVAEEALWQLCTAGGAGVTERLRLPERVVAALDARMDELYVATVAVRPVEDSGSSNRAWSLHLEHEAALCAPEALKPPDGPVPALAGNALSVYGHRLPAGWQGGVQVPAWPTASAVLRLVPGLWAQGRVVDAAGAQPLYVRNKVAQTTEEREQAKADKAALALAPGAGQ